MAKSSNAMVCMIFIMFVLFSPLTHATPSSAPKATSPIMPLKLSTSSRSTRIAQDHKHVLDFNAVLAIKAYASIAGQVFQGSGYHHGAITYIVQAAIPQSQSYDQTTDNNEQGETIMANIKGLFQREE
ncbi:hypothetical protein RND71_002305 [Anisodus tanguticus]|uniref:Uncharacterized protein n=1 Tax=Anisodus tanguticus TaxID=243964 RepID=A0AAE1SZK1_9SOLA|nr:hypothetical protein RND71_002305 [Anisodus tanguticus]